ncbi:hypothetical protein JHD50_01450 [Sulfurimonas sp. MAG313]|nr:hypothetical protein [Sulfurimonas sp. MAG313]MDF1879974.1 hypothetical protein [Sulfurimonas sp. MAG313]
MDRSIEEIYTSISQMVLRGISEDFTEAILEVELHSLALKISGGFQCTKESEPRAFLFLKENKKVLMKDLVELHLKTDLDEQSHWNTMTYTLYSSGEYKVDLVWNQSLSDKVQSVYAQA